MKQIIFKSKYGHWNIIARNYKNKNDTAYVKLFFPQGSEPVTTEESMWIDIEDCTLTSYEGKVGMTIFKYHETLSPKKQAEEDALKKTEERVESNKISLDDLPF